MSVVARFDGGEGEVVALDGERLEVISPKAFAPGQPIRFEALIDDASLSLEGRTIQSKKRDDARFTVRLRLVNLSRPTKDRLQQALGAQGTV